MYLLICLICSVFHCAMSFSNECFQSSFGDKMVPALIGHNISLPCPVVGGCPKYRWRISPARGVYEDLDEGVCSLRYNACHEVNNNGNNVLRVNSAAVSKLPYFQCYCSRPLQIPEAFACQTLTPYIEVYVSLAGIPKVFSDSCEESSSKHVINVMSGQRVTVNCSEMTELDSNCSPGSLASPFIVTKFHQGCYIKCNFTTFCNVIVSVNVVHQETSTSHTTTARKATNEQTSVTKGSFQTDGSKYHSIVIALVVLVILLLLVAVGLCVYLLFPKRNRQFKTITLNNFMISSQSPDVRTTTYTCVTEDKDMNKSFDPFVLSDPTNNYSSDIRVTNTTSSSDIVEPLKPQEKGPPVSMNDSEDTKSTVTNNDNHQEGTKLLTVTSMDKETFGEIEMQSGVQEMASCIPEYAEVKKHQDNQFSLLYATVDKNRK